jgi:mRNA-degrading endonuclease RelE of RelBE toxin-antitoxin system
MVKSWQKYIDKLSNKEKIIFKNVIEKIILWDFDELDIKKLSWFKEIYRCRIWWKRILFEITNNWIEILKIWPRWDIYKN